MEEEVRSRPGGEVEGERNQSAGSRGGDQASLCVPGHGSLGQQTRRAGHDGNVGICSAMHGRRAPSPQHAQRRERSVATASAAGGLGAHRWRRWQRGSSQRGRQWDRQPLAPLPPPCRCRGGGKISTAGSRRGGHGGASSPRMLVVARGSGTERCTACQNARARKNRAGPCSLSARPRQAGAACKQAQNHMPRRARAKLSAPFAHHLPQFPTHTSATHAPHPAASAPEVGLQQGGVAAAAERLLQRHTEPLLLALHLRAEWVGEGGSGVGGGAAVRLSVRTRLGTFAAVMQGARGRRHMRPQEHAFMDR